MISDEIPTATTSIIIPPQIPQEYNALVQRRTQIWSRLETISIVPKPISEGDAKNNNDSNKTTGKKKQSKHWRKSKSTTTTKLLPSKTIHTLNLLLIFNTTTSAIHYKKSTDTHWDYLLKEMLWLSADFTSERKRQKSMAKKQASAVQLYFATQEQRAMKVALELEVKRRKMASRISREVVTKWWQGKIERVIAYKQKIQGQYIQKQYMDQQLFILIQQTEKYSKTLNQQLYSIKEEEEDKRKRRKRNKPLTIEEALQQSDQQQRIRLNSSLQRFITPVDSTFHTSNNTYLDKELYGESTEEEGEDDEDWLPFRTQQQGDEDIHMMNGNDSDNESTLSEAERIDQMERRRWRQWKRKSQEDDHDDDEEEEYSTCGTDPEELQKLQEESTMDIQLVLERLERDAKEILQMTWNTNNNIDSVINLDDMKSSSVASSRMNLDDKLQRHEVEVQEDVGSSEDYIEDEGDVVADDESTMEAEEKLGRDMSYADELALLQKDNEMSVDDLRALYSGVGQHESTEDNDNIDDGSEEYTQEDEEDGYEISTSSNTVKGIK